MLPKAKQWLEQILEVLGPEIDAGTPVVFLEPSCAAVFRDEMSELLPGNDRAGRLAQQSFLLDEYLKKIGYKPRRLERTAVLHGHCHQKAIMGMDPTVEMLSAMGVKAELLDDGCCGMAGSFGFEDGHYDVSMKVGEHGLLPRVRAASPHDLIISDGFSCREQIAQTTDRKALHLADVLAMGLHEGPAGPPQGMPESKYVQKPARVPWMPVAAVAAAGIAALLLLRRR
jgi:Fe-S oxidoreductase